MVCLYSHTCSVHLWDIAAIWTRHALTNEPSRMGNYSSLKCGHGCWRCQPKQTLFKVQQLPRQLECLVGLNRKWVVICREFCPISETPRHCVVQLQWSRWAAGGPCFDLDRYRANRSQSWNGFLTSPDSRWLSSWCTIYAKFTFSFFIFISLLLFSIPFLISCFI